MKRKRKCLCADAWALLLCVSFCNVLGDERTSSPVSPCKVLSLTRVLGSRFRV